MNSFIIVPRTNYVSAYTAPYTVLEVAYYAPGRFKVVNKIAECDHYATATRIATYGNADIP